MGLAVFTSTDGRPLRKQYSFDGVCDIASFNPGSYFNLIERLEELSPNDIQSLYHRANTDNLASMFAQPKGNGWAFQKVNDNLESQGIKELLCDIEWAHLPGAPDLSDNPNIHLQYILRCLGFSNPSEITAYIIRSPSCGLKLKKDKPYRFHLWLFLDKKRRQEAIEELLEKKFPHQIVDSSVYRKAQMIAIQRGDYAKEVERPDFAEMDYLQIGRRITMEEVESLTLDYRFEKEFLAKSLIEDAGVASQGHQQFKTYFGKKNRPPIDANNSLAAALSKMANDPKGNYLDGRRNTLLYFFIRQAIINTGDASELIDFIVSHPKIRGDWDRHQLDKKAEWAWNHFSLVNKVGGMNAHFQPNRVIRLNEKDISDLDVSDLPMSGIVILNTPEGSGKTELILRKWMEEYKRRNANGAPRILYECFRRAVLRQVSEEYGLDNYETLGKEEAERTGLSDKERKERFCPTSQRLAICNRSLICLKPGNRYPDPYDVVITDEVEAFLEDVFLDIRFGDASETPWVDREKQWELKKRIDKQAKLVILADASASGLLTGWYADLIARERKEEKTLIVNDADYIADKVIRFIPNFYQALREIVRHYRNGEIISVHCGFGNNETQTMEACKGFLEHFGIPGEEIGLYYPDFLDKWEKEQTKLDPNAPTYRSKPDIVMNEEIAKGRRIFFNSPALGVGWSVKDVPIDRIVGLFNSKIFTATWIKQFLRRIRKAPKIDVYIPSWTQTPPMPDTENLVAEVLEDDFPFESFTHLQARGTLNKILKRQYIKKSFKDLLIEAKASFTEEEEWDVKIIKSLHKSFSISQKGAIEAHMGEPEQEDIVFHNFLKRNGETININKVGTDDRLQMCLWHKHRSEQIFPLIKVWLNPEEMSLMNANWHSIQTLMNLVLKEIDYAFGAATGSSSFIDWFCSKEEVEASFWLGEHSPQSGRIEMVLKKHSKEIQRIFFPDTKASRLDSTKLFEELSEIFYLDGLILPTESLKSQGFNAAEVKAELKKKYKIRSKNDAELRQKLFVAIASKTTRLTDKESAFMRSHFKKLYLRKRAYMPAAVNWAKYRIEDKWEESF